MWIFINNLQLYTWVYITFIVRNLLLQNYLSYLLDILAVKKWKTEKYNTQCFLYIPSLPSLFSKIYSCKRKATRSRNARDSRSLVGSTVAESTANFLFSRCCRATMPFLHPAHGVYTAKAAREPPHILAQLLRPALHCLRAGFHKVGRLLMKPRPHEAPRISCSRGYSYDCCKQRRSIINVRKRDYFLPSTLSSLFLFLSFFFFWHLDWRKAW